MHERVAHSKIILNFFVIPLVTSLLMAYAAMKFFVWCFPSSLGGLNFTLMLPVWFMTYARSFGKNTLIRLSLPDAQVKLIICLSAALMMAWFYYALRASLYSPLHSALGALGMILISIGGEYFGRWLETKQRRTRA